MKTLTSVAVALGFSICALAQAPPRIVSPEVQSDGGVIFRLRAPNVLKVEVSVEGQSPATPMQKDEQGVWSATVARLQPDIYGYSLNCPVRRMMFRTAKSTVTFITRKLWAMIVTFTFTLRPATSRMRERIIPCCTCCTVSATRRMAGRKWA